MGLVLRFGDVVLDVRRLELSRGGAVQNVERKVFALIAHLARNADRVVTKDELLDEVWEGRFVGESVVTRSISLARKVIGDSAAIKTHYGRGYRFMLPVIVEETELDRHSDAPISERPIRERHQEAHPVLAGRGSELGTLLARLALARDRQGGFTLIRGEAGIGKTRLCERLASEARAMGVRVAWGYCSEAGLAPGFWPWVQVLRGLSDESDAET